MIELLFFCVHPHMHAQRIKLSSRKVLYHFTIFAIVNH